MTEVPGKGGSRQVGIPEDGRGVQAEKVQARHCALCGLDANVQGVALERFGEAFCSEAHAEEFVAKVREARVQAVAGRVSFSTAPAESPAAPAPPACAATQRGWKGYLWKGLCWGVPVAALVFLLSGGSAVLGAGAAILPLLAALACPLAMYFMMRGMMKMEGKMGPKGQASDKGEEK